MELLPPSNYFSGSVTPISSDQQLLLLANLNTLLRQLDSFRQDEKLEIITRVTILLKSASTNCPIELLEFITPVTSYQHTHPQQPDQDENEQLPNQPTPIIWPQPTTSAIISSLLALANSLLLTNPPTPLPPHLSSTLALTLSPFPTTSSTSTSLLTQFTIDHILNKTLPPIFNKNNHPKVNPHSGRTWATPRTTGTGMMDWFEESPLAFSSPNGQENSEGSWRTMAPSLQALLSSILLKLEPAEIMHKWNVILPPLLAFLDDFDPEMKWRGCSILNVLVERWARDRQGMGEWLARTGMGGLFLSSLESASHSLTSPYTSLLLPLSGHLSLQIIHSLHHPHPTTTQNPPKDTTTRESFQKLTQFFETFFVRTWSFASGNLVVELATVKLLLEVLPCPSTPHPDHPNLPTPIILRYLPLLIPHLSTVISSPTSTLALVAVTLETLERIVGLVKPFGREKKWSGVIVREVGRCWVELGERGGGEGKEEVRELCRALVRSLDAQVQVEKLITIANDAGQGGGRVFDGLVSTVG
ncbi:hypothetical protein T439DRAFT_381723 [Meredithblackwellia eburnea MCA 4105]